jgi:hypothetical protein
MSSYFIQKHAQPVGVAEWQIYKELLDRGLRVISQKQIAFKHPITGEYTRHPIDIVLEDYGLAVEVYGVSHHKPRRAKYDEYINKKMTEMGYRLYVVDLNMLGYKSGKLPKKVIDPLCEDIVEVAKHGQKQMEEAI